MEERNGDPIGNAVRRKMAIDRRNRPTIVCLCGSTRFMDTFAEVARNETLAGKIVLTVSDIITYNGATDPQRANPEQKDMLDELHLRKIDLADEIFVLNVEGYIGDSTNREIAYAEKTGKVIKYLEPAGAMK